MGILYGIRVRLYQVSGSKFGAHVKTEHFGPSAIDLPTNHAHRLAEMAKKMFIYLYLTEYVHHLFKIQFYKIDLIYLYKCKIQTYIVMSSSHWNNFEASNGARSQKRQKTAYAFESLPNASVELMKETPDILQATVEQPNRSATLMVAETTFFNQQNQDFWQRTDLSHLRPYDFPYVRALVQQKPCDTLSPEDIKHKEHIRVSIQVVTRAYEEEYLREPMRKERPCIMGDQCQGMHLPHVKENAFVIREFLLPTEEEEYKHTGKLPTEGRLCLMCKRSEIARAFVNIRADGMGVKNNVILQDYRNIVGQDGEYCMDDCILSSPTTFQGLLDPVVLHLKNAYRLKIENGVRYYEQWRMKYPGQQLHFLTVAPETTK